MKCKTIEQTQGVGFIDARAEELPSASFDRVLKKGDIAPEFTLPDALGDTVSLLEELSGGPVILIFYHDDWCPYHHIDRTAYQRELSEIRTLGARLIAISPQKPDSSLAITEKDALGFAVLSDAGGVVARRFGLVYPSRDDRHSAAASPGVNHATINGTENRKLLIPVTFAIGSNGRILLTHVVTDFRKRLVPEEIVAALRPPIN
jgi:peroxiredoxin